MTIVAPIGTLHRERRARPGGGPESGDSGGNGAGAGDCDCDCNNGGGGIPAGAADAGSAGPGSPRPAFSSPRILSTLIAEGYDCDSEAPPSSMELVA